MQSVFYRIEKRYLIDKNMFQILQRKLESYMQLDEHGTYTLCNIYYDTLKIMNL